MVIARTAGLLVAACALAPNAAAQPLTSAFTYQGEVRVAGQPGTGAFDLRFRLYDAAANGNQLGLTQCADNVALVEGVFVVTIDFGATVFNGNRRFLEIEARPDTGLGCGTTTGYTVLSPRQELTATPHATYAVGAGTASNATRFNNQSAAFYQDAGNLNAGSLPGARLAGPYGNTVTFSNVSNQFTGAFTGSGAGLTNLPAGNLVGGPISDGLLPTTIARRNAANAFTGSSNWFQTPAYFSDLVGVGTVQPDVLLHVYAGFSGAAAPSTNALVAIERDQNAYLNFLTPTTSLAGILFGSSVNVADGGVLYDHTFRSLQFRTGGNVTRAVINPSGFLGIGTTVPETALHVQSTADVTTSGSGILTLGNYPNGSFLHADGNELQAFSADLTSTLFLNALGGNVAIGGNGASPSARLDVAGSFAAVSASIQSGIHAGGVLTLGDAGNNPRLEAGSFQLGDSRFRLNSSADRYCRLELTEDDAQSYGAWFEYDGIRNWLSIGTMSPSFGEAIRIVRGSENVQFFGTISKAGGSFQIDHPLDPENKYLYHSFVESPDMMNIYNGNVSTDADGFATITLPDWFEALNRDFRYQVTVIDEDAPDGCSARVARRIGSAGPNTFVIKSVPGNLDVSWQITGIRKDAFANANRIPVEVEKSGEDKGKYLHPAAFGQPPERGIGAVGKIDRGRPGTAN